MDLSPAQLQIMRHMLGIDTPYTRDPVSYRNYYCAPPGDAGMQALMERGAIERYGEVGSYDWFRCTEAGRLAAVASHRTIRKPKGARLYARFLDLKDCWPDLTFKRFLTDPSLRRLRQEA